MAISFTTYVDIVSSVGAGESVAERQLIGRLMTDNNLLPPGTYLEFPNNNDGAANVGTYFGVGSNEQLRAAFYCSWISKNGTAPPSISFGRWVDTVVGSQIHGAVANYALGSFTPISAAGFTLTLGGFTHTLTNINLSAAASLAAVAADVQTAINGYSAGGAAWTGATVAYNTTRQSFDFVSGAVGPDTIAVAPAPTGIDLAGPLGWLTGAILCDGTAVESITETLANQASISNNFGSYLFMPALTTAQIVESATWNNGNNLMFQYMIPVAAAGSEAQNDAEIISAAIANLAGCAMTLSLNGNQYPEMCPMMIMAATDYTQRNSVQNYMFQIFNLIPSVTNDADYATYTNLRVNFYGETQTAGQLISFYQRGVLTGLASSPLDQNTYANEQWLKDAAGSSIMTLLLALAAVSANNQGIAQLLSVLQTVINQALLNGTISVGKPLTTVQQLYITNATGNSKAWYQVQNSGYWLSCNIVSYTDPITGTLEYKAVYTLIYSKDDIIRLVDGTHILI